jgi:hypothetical protein
VIVFSAIKNLYFPSRLLLDHELKAMCEGGKVLEHDERGVKVIQLTNGDVLKIFRARNRLSGTRIYSHARRFCRNAFRLQHLNIPTVKIKALFHLETNGHTAVLYEPLAGESIRDLVHKDIKRIKLTAKTFGCFLATLHFKGIHFHSLHTGNVLLLPNNEFGLIDISDMTIFSWPLFSNTRLRSFKRLCKYKGDIQALGAQYWSDMLEAYFISSSHCGLACREKLLRISPFK